MREAGNLVLLSGVEDQMMMALEASELMEAIGAENIFRGTKRLGESTQNALNAAQSWIENRKSE